MMHYFDRIISGAGIGMEGRPCHLQVTIIERQTVKLAVTHVTLVKTVSLTRHLTLAKDGTCYEGWNTAQGKAREIVQYSLKPREKEENAQAA